MRHMQIHISHSKYLMSEIHFSESVTWGTLTQSLAVRVGVRSTLPQLMTKNLRSQKASSSRRCNLDVRDISQSYDSRQFTRFKNLSKRNTMFEHVGTHAKSKAQFRSSVSSNKRARSKSQTPKLFHQQTFQQKQIKL